MRFRPCIDIHDGTVKQIVGASLDDASGSATENFTSVQGAAYYARLYRERDLTGGHLIILNRRGTKEYESSKRQAMEALRAYPGGLMVGGGLDSSNVSEFLSAGASAGIFTSYVFSDGRIRVDRLQELKKAIGREHIVLDLSCKRKGEDYYVVTDRWQKFTDEKLSVQLLGSLEEYACEYLIHAADVEGKRAGADERLLSLLGGYDGLPVTYAGGVASYEDLREIRRLTAGKIDVTVGSALDIFGGSLELEKILSIM